MFLTKYDRSDQTQKQIGRTCGMHSGKKQCLNVFYGGGKVREIDHLEDLEIDGRIVLR